jgi:NAD(P) transhydrogenase subunit alpha
LSAMRAGSVAVDLAVERGGNIEGSEAGKIVDVEGVKVLGHNNVAGRIAASASLLYAKNLLTFLETMISKETKTLSINQDDELVKATMLTTGNAVVHPNFGGSSNLEAVTNGN